MNTVSSELTAHPHTHDAPLPAATFGQLALAWQAIAQQLEGAAAEAFRAFVLKGVRPNKAQMDAIGQVVLLWAQARGATHYAHWFQPLTGLPAEKHDAFLNISAGPEGQTEAIEELRGNVLWQGEPDASSFPSGGLRATHTARGYTVWDPKTPMFIRRDNGGCTLVIPCSFISYTGHALDHKTSLLRAAASLDKHATRFMNLLDGHQNVKTVYATLGTEQEYFLVDRAHYARRPDLIMAGRTLLGVTPPRNQQLEDHYFGIIPSRVQGFMADAEAELFRLGVPAKTRHCEVAPSQFEIAPIFEELSVACDHNVLTMETLKRVAERHGLVALFHEKPFAGINGSGKHNNWSMSTDTGINLLDPGTSPAEHLRFVAVLSVVLLAIHRHADVLRASIASSGNDHRLGANEAPPSIISAYLGEAVDALATAAEGDGPLEIGLGELQKITEHLLVKLDATDRNRTAPFAFTGNKFEYRAVGSNENCAWPMTVLNAAVADTFQELGDRLQQSVGDDREQAVRALVKDVLTQTRAIRFEGNGYSQEWREEAARRGLPNMADTPSSLVALGNAASIAVFDRQGVLNAAEMHARQEIFAERYIKWGEIEALTLVEIAQGQVLPALEEQVAKSHAALAAYSGGSSKRQRARLDTQLDLLERLQDQASAVLGALSGIHAAGDTAGQAHYVSREVIGATQALRVICDQAETVVADALWPMPTYRELLFPAR